MRLLPYMILCVPLLFVGCAAMKSAGTAVAGLFTSENVEVGIAVASTMPGWIGLVGKGLGLIFPFVAGELSKKAMDKAGVEEHRSEKPAGLENA